MIETIIFRTSYHPGALHTFHEQIVSMAKRISSWVKVIISRCVEAAAVPSGAVGNLPSPPPALQRLPLRRLPPPTWRGGFLRVVLLRLRLTSPPKVHRSPGSSIGGVAFPVAMGGSWTRQRRHPPARRQWELLIRCHLRVRCEWLAFLFVFINQWVTSCLRPAWISQSASSSPPRQLPSTRQREVRRCSLRHCY